MFRPKDKYGLFIYTSKEACNGKEAAMWMDDCDNNHKAEIINNLQNVNTDILEIIVKSRTNLKLIYGHSLRKTIPNEILKICNELRYCYAINKHILIIRKRPINTKKGIKEKFIGLYFQKL